MGTYDVAIIGTGAPPDTESDGGYSMGYRHARAYQAVDGCEIRACADIVSDHAARFAEAFDLPVDRAYSDNAQLLEETGPDIVSICTPPSTHLDLVTDYATHEAVRAIHCEKPMAVTFGACRRMVDVCANHGVQLTINLQHRCSEGVETVSSLVEDGIIGDLTRIEIGRRDLLQTGLHQIGVANYVRNDEPIQWVLGQIDCADAQRWYTDMHVESRSVGMWEYESGVYGLCATGDGVVAVEPGTAQFVGTDGRITADLGAEEFSLRADDTAGWEPIEIHESGPQQAAIRDVVNGLDDGDYESSISGRAALAATEVVFGIWESARRRGRVDLPLTIEDNPLEQLVESSEYLPD